jgi:hypothetical protein
LGAPAPTDFFTVYGILLVIFMDASVEVIERMREKELNRKKE